MRHINKEVAAKSMAATINSLCREEKSLKREELLDLLDQIVSSPARYLMPLRKNGIVSLKDRQYNFKKQNMPIHYSFFLKLINKENVLPIKKSEDKDSHKENSQIKTQRINTCVGDFVMSSMQEIKY